MAISPFAYKELDYNNAKKQAQQQVDPLYQRTLQNIQTQKRQNQMNAGQQSAARGLSHSGLAADQLNKISIASQGQVTDTNNERASRISELAQNLIDRDRANSDRMYGRYRDKITDQRYDIQFGYQKARDAVSDNQWSKQFEYTKQRDGVGDKRYNDQFNYQKYRDTIADNQNRQALQFEKEKFKSETEWRAYVYKNMSASEKAQMDLNRQQFGEEMAWKIEESNRSDKLSRDQMEFTAGQAGFQEP